jgi:OTU domain-containing protein 6
VHTRSQIAQLTRELSGAAGGGRTAHARTEDEIIDAQLSVLGKAVYQIRPDGDCLFSALADQLRRLAPNSTGREARGGPDALRSAAASEMRANADEYAPFLTEDLVTYAARIEGPTHEWGGHLELRALSEALRCIIVVHSANEPPLRLEPTPPVSNSATASAGSPAPARQVPELHISYHQQQYMLGEHYNSVIPAAEVRGARNQSDDDGWTVA